MNIFQIAPALLGSISLYLVAYHLTVYFRLKEPALHPRVHLWFAILCFFTGIYDFLCTGLYLSMSTPEGVLWQRAQFLITQLFPLTFIWFLYEYISAPRKQVIKFITIGLVSFFCLSLLAPMEWIFNLDSPLTKVVIFTPDLIVTYYEVESGVLSGVINGIYFTIGIYFFYFIVQYYRQHRKEARLFVAAFFVYFLCGLNDLFVMGGIFNTIYLIEYGYIALIILMNFRLSRSFVNTLTKMYSDASEISKLKTNMLMFATHELKTPLIPIMGWVEMVKYGMANGIETQKLIGQTEIDSIFNAAQRLNRIIDEFLDLGRIDSGRLTLNKEPCHLLDLVNNALATIASHAKNRHVSISNQVIDVDIQCDKIHIEQVFINILFNAIKFSPADSTIDITSENAGGSSCITFRDHGAGLSPEDLKNVWNPLSSTLKSKGDYIVPSTGVGLFLSKTIIDKHAGSIQIESPGPKQGTIVTIHLPLK